MEKHIIYLDELLQQTAQELGWKRDDQQLLAVISSIFIAIRNRLPFEDSLLFMNLLPLPFKAIYLNQWKISEQTPDPLQNMDDLVNEIFQYNPVLISKLKGDRTTVQHLVEALFLVISYHISKADLKKALSFLPEDVQRYLDKHHVGEY